MTRHFSKIPMLYILLPPLTVTTLNEVPVKFLAWLPSGGCLWARGTEPTEVNRRLTQIIAIPLTMYYRLLDFVSLMSFKYSQK